jgi:hypothetical protein
LVGVGSRRRHIGSRRNKTKDASACMRFWVVFHSIDGSWFAQLIAIGASIWMGQLDSPRLKPDW